MRKVPRYLLVFMLLTPNTVMSGGCNDQMSPEEMAAIYKMMSRERVFYCIPD